MGAKYFVFTEAIGNANEKYLVAIFNNQEDTRLRIQDIRIFNATPDVSTGGVMKWNIKKISGVTGGNVIRPVSAFAGDPDISSLVTCYSNATGVTDGDVLMSTWGGNTADVGASGLLSACASINAKNLLPCPVELTKGHGIAVKQKSNLTTGKTAVLVIVEFILGLY